MQHSEEINQTLGGRKLYGNDFVILSKYPLMKDKLEPIDETILHFGKNINLKQTIITETL